MALDYAAIKTENIGRYGTDIVDYGPDLLANRYDNRTHFIFELLQNAEDALKRRREGTRPRMVTFALSKQALQVSHYGEPFTEPDVKGICGIGKSTKSKDLTTIGRFGIGFKAVYAFTNSPAIYSGRECFAIDSYVWPRAIPPIEINPDETRFIFPFLQADPSAHADIASSLQNLGARTLLFLREIDEISWSVEDGKNGLYLRSKPDWITENARQVTLLGEEAGQLPMEETWLIFSRKVQTNEGVSAGYVEIAFLIDKSNADQQPRVSRINDSRLVVFFPTIVPTNLGFLIQGPYRTTPSRDNVPAHDSWNRHLVQETANLLVEALCTLREQGLLSADTLRTLPIARSKFAIGSMFEPLFNTVRTAFEVEPLLPSFQGGYVTSKHAKLAGTKDLRELLTPFQLSTLFAPSREFAWLSEEITKERTPELRQYLMGELDIDEVEPGTLLAKISTKFLESQTDAWIVQFYAFLSPLTRSRNLLDKPLIRLEDNCHIAPFRDKQPQVFLPGSVITNFPTVKKVLCEQPEALEFLKKIGLTEPDPVDDVVRHVLPKYQKQKVAVDDAQYEMDIQRILNASATDSNSQRSKLLNALRATKIVAAVNIGNGACCFAQPSDVYLATKRFKELFAGVSDVLLVDDTYTCLHGENVSNLLEACGVARYLEPIDAGPRFSRADLKEMRKNAGAENSSSPGSIEDFTLRGLPQLLDILPTLAPDEATQRSALLWEALCDVEDRRGHKSFSGTYGWKYYSWRTCNFPSAFVEALNTRAWVPDANKILQPPKYVVFDQIKPPWKSNPFLLSQIHFKPPIIEVLAKEAGIELDTLDLLKQLGLTSVADLKTRLGIHDEILQAEQQSQSEATKLADAFPEPTEIQPESTPAQQGNETQPGSGVNVGPDTRQPLALGGDHNAQNGNTLLPKAVQTSPTTSIAVAGNDDKATHDNVSARPFISYLATHPTVPESDPDGLSHEARMALEEAAINLILAHEPVLRRTPANNPGFDLFEPGAADQPIRWIEVKAMTKTLRSHPVAISHTQFECAYEHRAAYWLYIVEQAGLPEHARVVRIQDPVGKVRSFTFDYSWLNIAEVSRPPAEEQDREKQETEGLLNAVMKGGQL